MQLVSDAGCCPAAKACCRGDAMNPDARIAANGLPRVLLASKSPRRRQLLTQHGVSHDAEAPAVDDALLIRGGVTPAQWVAALAYFKAAEAMHRLGEWGYAPGELVIVGADTVVRNGAELIGQPRDAADAERIVRLLEDGRHEVLTGVALIDAGTGERDMFVDRAAVSFGSLGEDRIQAYVASGEWRGKAGGYNYRDCLDAGWPLAFEGDVTTVMGLPMQRLPDRLREFRDRVIRGDVRRAG